LKNKRKVGRKEEKDGKSETKAIFKRGVSSQEFFKKESFQKECLAIRLTAHSNHQ
jgi:hypothetical protein